jgi:AraC-like DNA-binding protein
VTHFLGRSTAKGAADTPQVTSQTFFGALHEATTHPPHSHDEDQLYWFPDGAVNVLVGAQRWLVPTNAAFWFPAGIAHSVEPLNSGVTRSVYSAVPLRPPGERWNQPRAISCTALMAEISRYMSSGSPTPATRAACHVLLSQLMQDAPEHHASLVTPTHLVARAIAERVLADPRDDTPLSSLASQAGVSSRTIMRAFVAETGSGFTRWRTQARLIASLSLLSSGMAVSSVADRIGYRTTSGYINAFRNAYGTTPAAYARETTTGGAT